MILFLLVSINAINIFDDIINGKLVPHDAIETHQHIIDTQKLTKELKAIDISKQAKNPSEMMTSLMQLSTVFDSILFEYPEIGSSKDIVEYLFRKYPIKSFYFFEYQKSPAILKDDIFSFQQESNGKIFEILDFLKSKNGSNSLIPFLELCENFISELKQVKLVEPDLKEPRFLAFPWNYEYAKSIESLNKRLAGEISEFRKSLDLLKISNQQAERPIEQREESDERSLERVEMEGLPARIEAINHLSTTLEILFEIICTNFSLEKNTTERLYVITYQFAAIQAILDAYKKVETGTEVFIGNMRKFVTNYILSKVFVTGNLIIEIENYCNNELK